MKNCASKKEITHSALSKVMRFGSDLFSPLIPPLTTSITSAVNPQDIILNRETVLPLYLQNINDDHQSSLIPLNNAVAIGPAGYIETVRSPYSSFGDIFFDVTTPDSSFSIECKSDDSNGGNIHGRVKLCEPLTRNSDTFAMRSSSDEEPSLGYTLPPSSAILQSQLDNSSLDYFIRNNSFIEEIKSSFSMEQQQYINSGMTNSSSTMPCTTMPLSLTTRSDDMITPNYLESVNILQPDVTIYDGMFENSASEDESDNFFSITVSPSTKYFSLDEEDDDNTMKSKNLPVDEKGDEHIKEKLISLLRELNILNEMESNCSTVCLEEIKKKYTSEINDAFVCSSSWTTVNDKEDNLKNLYFAIIKSYNAINDKLVPILARTNVKKVGNISDCSIRVSDKKRKLSEKNTDVERKRYKRKTVKKDIPRKVDNKYNEDVRKSRKNYNSDTINILMDWYLENDGKPPTAESKQNLSDLTRKTDIQITTWFQNARRRYQNKLEIYQVLNTKYPALVYDYQSLKAYMKANR
ncbi:unnamed protein product [Mucor hiemalis]